MTEQEPNVLTPRILVLGTLLGLLSYMIGEDRAWRVVCFVSGHRPAHEVRYGVEEVCLDCGKVLSDS